MGELSTHLEWLLVPRLLLVEIRRLLWLATLVRLVEPRHRERGVKERGGPGAAVKQRVRPPFAVAPRGVARFVPDFRSY